MRTKTLLTTLTATAALTAGSAQAGLLLYEGFDYTLADEDSISTQNGGTGWSAAWAGDHTFTTTGLTYTNGATLATTGGALADASTSGNLTSNRAYSSSLIGTDSTVWFSYLINSTAGKFEQAKFDSLGGYNVEPGFGTNNSTGDVTDGNIAASIDSSYGSTFGYTEGTTVFVLGKMEYSSSGNETLSVWFNIDLTTSEGSLGAADSTVTTASAATGDLFNFYTGAGHLGVIDEIRLGDGFADVVVVVPEPGSLALLGLGGLLIGARRRRSA